MTASQTTARKTTARKYTDEQWAAIKAERAALAEAVKNFEPESDRAQDAYDRLTEKYSHLNSLLIIMQRPGTRGDVRNKSDWQTAGLGKIRKGQHGLLIRRPARPDDRNAEEAEVKAADGTSKKLRFFWVRVYDRSQMEAWGPRKGEVTAAMAEAIAPGASTDEISEFLNSI